MSDTKNELETLLEKAATEPAHRPAFFSALLEATVWVPGRAADGEQIVEDSALDLQHWEKDDGTSVIPFFTSLEALQQAVADEQAFVMMPARTLMAMTLGESLFLNPKLPSGKEFTPREISHLLGEEGSPLSTQTVLEGGEALLLSEVAEPPAQIALMSARGVNTPLGWYIVIAQMAGVLLAFMLVGGLVAALRSLLGEERCRAWRGDMALFNGIVTLCVTGFLLYHMVSAYPRIFAALH